MNNILDKLKASILFSKPGKDNNLLSQSEPSEAKDSGLQYVARDRAVAFYNSPDFAGYQVLLDEIKAEMLMMLSFLLTSLTPEHLGMTKMFNIRGNTVMTDIGFDGGHIGMVYTNGHWSLMHVTESNIQPLDIASTPIEAIALLTDMLLMVYESIRGGK